MIAVQTHAKLTIFVASWFHARTCLQLLWSRMPVHQRLVEPHGDLNLQRGITIIDCKISTINRDLNLFFLMCCFSGHICWTCPPPCASWCNHVEPGDISAFTSSPKVACCSNQSSILTPKRHRICASGAFMLGLCGGEKQLEAAVAFIHEVLLFHVVPKGCQLQCHHQKQPHQGSSPCRWLWQHHCPPGEGSATMPKCCTVVLLSVGATCHGSHTDKNRYYITAHAAYMWGSESWTKLWHNVK